MKFPTAAVLSLTTGKLLYDGDVSEPAKLMEYMCGQPVPLIFRDAAGWECREELIKQIPVLEFMIPDGDWKVWLKEQYGICGDELEVTPLPQDKRDQLSKLVEELPPEAKLQWVKDGGYRR